MKTPTQIAEKWAKMLWNGGPKEELLQANADIILSAIEEALELEIADKIRSYEQYILEQRDIEKKARAEQVSEPFDATLKTI